MLWPSSFGTGKAEASMRTSPSSQGPNTPGYALWQDKAGSKGVRPGFPGRAEEPGLLRWVDLGWLGPAGVRWVMRGSNGCFWVVSHSITRSQQRPIHIYAVTPGRVSKSREEAEGYGMR